MSGLPWIYNKNETWDHIERLRDYTDLLLRDHKEERREEVCLSLPAFPLQHVWWISAVISFYRCLVAQSCPALCNPLNCSPPGSSVLGIFQARVLEWVAISLSRGSSPPRGWTWVSCIAGGFSANWATREAPFFHDFSNLNLFVLMKWNEVKWSRSVMSDSLRPRGL